MKVKQLKEMINSVDEKAEVVVMMEVKVGGEMIMHPVANVLSGFKDTKCKQSALFIEVYLKD